MNNLPARFALSWLFLCVFFLAGSRSLWAQSSVVVRVMASNLTSGNNQRYESAGLHILKGLKPDVVALQEFNYASGTQGVNTPAALREMVDTTFGTGFAYFRETGYSIPNGIISRYPILASGSWTDSDTGVNDRGFAWARIDVPGTNDLYVVSVHLKASSGSGNAARRTAEAAEIKNLIAANFPSRAWVIVAGDMNIFDDAEGAVATFGTILSDTPVPVDQNGDADTNASRATRYDRVLFSYSMTNTLVPVVMPSRTYATGLVFDSRVYTRLTDVPPVAVGDSGASQMQHMAVVRDFRFMVQTTNTPSALPATLSRPELAGNQFRFLVTGSTGMSYIVQTSTNLSTLNWISVQTNSAPFTFSETNAFRFKQRFYRSVAAPQ